MIPMAITLKKGGTVNQDRYAVVGMAASCVPGGDPHNMWLVELDGLGNLTMIKVYDFKVLGMAAGPDYYNAEPYSANHSIPMDIKPVYFDDVTGNKGYIIAGFVTENINNPVPFDVEPPFITPQARRQACFLRITDNGSILWGRTIETGAVPKLNHNWTLANKIIEIPGEGFAFTGMAIQHFNLGGPYGLPGGILTGGFGYLPPATVGAHVQARITIVNEAGAGESCGADPANAVFYASGNDLLFDPVTKRVHLLGSGIQIQGPCCALTFVKGKPYLIVGEIDPMAGYSLDLTTTRLLNFTAIPSSGANTDRPAIVGSRVFFDPDNNENLIETGYFHNAIFADNGGSTGSFPFFLKYHYPSQTVVGYVAQVFPHPSSNYYTNYYGIRTFSPLNNFINTAGITDFSTANGMRLHAFAPYLPTGGQFYLANNVVSLSAPNNLCYQFTTQVTTFPSACPTFAMLPTGGLPDYKLIYTASTPLAMPTPTVVRASMPATSLDCASAPFRPASVAQQATTLAEENSDATVYPVPAGDVIYLRANPYSSYRVQNATGQVLMDGVTSREEEAIDIKQLPAGFYIIKVTNAAGQFTFTKFTKQ